MGQDFIDDNWGNVCDVYDYMEVSWSLWIHTTNNNETLLLEEMTDYHLLNTIKYFDNKCNTIFLKIEAKKRKLID